MHCLYEFDEMQGSITTTMVKKTMGRVSLTLGTGSA